MTTTKKAPLVSYLRVSTRKQGDSGLGLEGQRAAVAEYAAREGLRIVAEYVEVESGKKADRPELAKALDHCRASKATLVVARLDRLVRNVAFLSRLMESGLPFVCCDNPHATKLTIHVLAAVAEDEARAISERTKAALAAARKRGVLLGSSRRGHWKGREEERLAGLKKGRRRAAEVLKRDAQLHNSLIVTTALELRSRGASWQEIVEALNAQGFVTRRGNPWQKSSVYAAVKAAAGCVAVAATAGEILAGILT